MIRRIECRACGDKYREQHPGDVAAGFRIRQVYLSVKRPENHGITVNGVFYPMEDMRCDLCNEIITGQIAVATTTWNTEREGKPGPWEADFGTVLEPETVSTHDVLAGEKGPK